MSESAIAANFDKSSDVLLDLSFEVAFNRILAVYDFAQVSNVSIREIFGFFARIHSCFLANVRCVLPADAVQVRKGKNYLFVAGEINACNTSHKLGLSLPLFVFGVNAKDTNDTLALDDFASLTHFSDTRTHFHFVSRIKEKLFQATDGSGSPEPDCLTRRRIIPRLTPVFADFLRLFEPVDDSAPGQIVGR